MVIVKSRNKIPVRLTIERWNHILLRHPEMEGQKERILVLETIAAPDLIQEGDSGEFIAGRFYEESPLTSKFLMVVYREGLNDGFVITAYYASKPSERRRVLWKL